MRRCTKIDKYEVMQHGDGDERTDHQARQSIFSWIDLYCNRSNICLQNVVDLQSFLRSCLRTISLISDKSRRKASLQAFLFGPSKAQDYGIYKRKLLFFVGGPGWDDNVG